MHLWNDQFHHTIPTDRLIFVLTIPSVLALRAVSRTAKMCVDEEFPWPPDQTSSALPAASFRLTTDIHAESLGQQLRALDH